MQVSCAIRRLLVAFALLLAVPASAQVTLVPPGLSPGDTYHLVYVTSSTRNSIPTDIAEYDDFVQGLADTEDIGVGSPIGDITWKVIGSTSVDAIDHMGSSLAPIYRLGGVLVANGTADLWDGALIAPINVDEEGVTREVLMSTGTEVSGVGATLGATPLMLGSTSVRLADSGATDETWIESGFFSSAAIGRAFYGISDPLTVAGPIPSAPRWTWLLLGLLLIGTTRFAHTHRGREARENSRSGD